MDLKTCTEYLNKGFTIIPVVHWGDFKKPALDSWEEYETRKNTMEEIEEWCTNKSLANIGIVTGEISGITVLDIDVKHGGTNDMVKHIKTPVVRTGGGGWHYYFQYAFPGDSIGFIPGYDIKSKGYVIAPPSKHKSGNNYTWEVDLDTPLAPLPGFLLEMLKKSKYNPGVKKLDYALNVSEGGRNNYATRILGGLIKNYRDDLSIAWTQALLWNEKFCVPSLEETELRNVFDSILKKESRRPLESPTIDHIPTIGEVDVQTNVNRIETGFEALDKKLGGGMGLGHAYLLAAVEKAGKSSFLRKMIFQMASSGNKIAVIDTEDVGGASLIAMTAIAESKKSSEVTPSDIEKFKQNFGKDIMYMTRGNAGSILADSNGNFVIDRCISALEKSIDEGAQVCIFDNVTPFASEGKMSHNDRSRLMNSLISMAKRRNVLVIVVGHVNSSSKEADSKKIQDHVASGTQESIINTSIVTVKRPMAKDIFGGSVLTQFDCKLLLWRPMQNYTDTREHKHSWIIADEFRHGAPFSVYFLFDGERLDFTEADKSTNDSFYENFGKSIDK